MLVKLAVYFLMIAFPSVTSSLARDVGINHGINLGINLVIDYFPSVTDRLARNAGKTHGILARD